MDLTQLVAAVQALVQQVADLQKQVEALSNPTPTPDVFTQAEVDAVKTRVDEFKATLDSLVGTSV